MIKFKKSLSSIVLSACVVFSLACCSKKNEKKTLVLAEVNPPDSVAAQMDQYFADEVKKLTGGRIHIEVYASALLGDEKDVLDDMYTTKKIDLARISLFALNSYGAKKSEILTIPYIFNSRKHFWDFANSEYASQILLEPTSTPDGVMGLFLAEEGFRHFFSAKRLESIRDFEGQVIRIIQDPVMSQLVKNLKATEKHVPLFDINKEMLIGTIDAAEQPIVNYKANFLYSAAPNMILDGHTIGIVEMIMNRDTWNSLSAEDQAIFKKAGRVAADYCRYIVEEQENKALEELKAEGVTFTEVADKEPWKEICRDIIEEKSKLDLNLFNKIIELGKTR